MDTSNHTHVQKHSQSTQCTVSTTWKGGVTDFGKKKKFGDKRIGIMKADKKFVASCWGSIEKDLCPCVFVLLGLAEAMSSMDGGSSERYQGPGLEMVE